MPVPGNGNGGGELWNIRAIIEDKDQHPRECPGGKEVDRGNFGEVKGAGCWEKKTGEKTAN